MRLDSAFAKWDGPLLFDFVVKQADLIKAFGDAAPIGKHEHDQIAGKYRPRAVNQTDFPRGGNSRLGLKGRVEKLGNWQLVYTRGKGKVFDHATCTFFSAYAAIIDLGGTVPAVTMPSKMATKGIAKRMLFRGADGDVYTKYRKGYTIQPKHWLDKGLDNFMKMGHAGAAYQVAWRPSTSGG